MSAVDRRAFLVAAGTLLLSRSAGAEQKPPDGTTSNLFTMDQGAARPVRLPPKDRAWPSMRDDERDALERKLRCACGCTLDVHTCRTTDFSCKVSPAMHADVVSLVMGGYGASEILDAFAEVYGERVLMSPRRGVGVLLYGVPVVALIAASLFALSVRWTEVRREA